MDILPVTRELLDIFIAVEKGNLTILREALVSGYTDDGTRDIGAYVHAEIGLGSVKR
jgi:hypothetical protein